MVDHSRVKHYVSIVGIFSLTVFGGLYVSMIETPRPTVVSLIIASIAGLGGYSVKKKMADME